MVEMRDGVKLATDVHLPDGEGPFPTLVNRTPYNKAEDQPCGGAVGGIAAAVENGYAVVHQDTRGRFASEGSWEPHFNNQEDGYDTVEWAAEQKWSTGDVGMYGTSYKGETTWQAALADPPSLVAAAPLIAPADIYSHVHYMGGAYNLGTMIGWNAGNSIPQISRVDVSESTAAELESELQRVLENFDESVSHLPIIDHPAFDEGVAPHWRDWHEHPSYGEYWADVDVIRRIEEISTPVAMAGGWYDIFLRGQTEVYEAIDDRGRSVLQENQRMVLGPWTHDTLGTADSAGDLEFPDTAAYDLGDDLVFPWFDHWLKNEGDGLESRPSVDYYQMGDDEWRASDQWPPADAEATPYYLDSNGNATSRSGDGALTTEEPDSGAPTDTYDYDPLDPTPTRGGPTLGAVRPGAFDQASVEERDDVLVYTSEELDDSVAIAGDIRATLFVESTAPDTDFVVRLVDVDPDGYATNITEGVLRARYRNSLSEPKYMKSDAVYELEIDVRQVAHTFAAGHRIRLDVTSSNFPALDRNPNTTVPVAEATESDMRTATQTIYHDAERPSRIALPVTD